MTDTPSLPAQDLYFFDREDLQAIADEAAIREGLAYHKENRVIELDHDEELLWARVDDHESEIPFSVEVRQLGNDFTYQCDCGAANGESVCRHVVAALYAYADRRGKSDTLLSATDTAIKERVKRGQAEVKVEPMSGEPWFGAWRASSMTSTTHFPQTYHVTIRSLRRRANLCSCPDFANNQLGTCKHIEAVLHKVGKHPDYHQLKEQAAPLSYVYLAWDVVDAPKIRLHRAPSISDDLQGIVAHYFDALGDFSGRLPEDFFRLLERVEERGICISARMPWIMPAAWQRLAPIRCAP